MPGSPSACTMMNPPAPHQMAYFPGENWGPRASCLTSAPCRKQLRFKLLAAPPPGSGGTQAATSFGQTLGSRSSRTGAAVPAPSPASRRPRGAFLPPGAPLPRRVLSATPGTRDSGLAGRRRRCGPRASRPAGLHACPPEASQSRSSPAPG